MTVLPRLIILSIVLGLPELAIVFWLFCKLVLDLSPCETHAITQKIRPCHLDPDGCAVSMSDIFLFPGLDYWERTTTRMDLSISWELRKTDLIYSPSWRLGQRRWLIIIWGNRKLWTIDSHSSLFVNQAFYSHLTYFLKILYLLAWEQIE